MTRAKRKPGRKKGDAKGRTRPGKLTPTGGNHREATETAARAERRRQAWHLYVYDRLPMRRIAEILTGRGLPCTTKTIGQDIHQMFDEARAEQATIRTAAPEVEELRLSELDQVLRPLAMGELSDARTTGRGRKKKVVRIPLKTEASARIRMEAIGQLRRNGESRRKLLGLDKQADEGTVRVDMLVGMVRGLVADMLVIAGENVALRKQLGDALRRRFGVLEGEVAAP